MPRGRLKRTCVICSTKFETNDIRKKWCCSEHGYEYSMRLREKAQAKSAGELLKAKTKAKELSLTQALQILINKSVRIIDQGQRCISCGCEIKSKSHWKQGDNAGHFHSVGSNNTLRFHLMNIWRQCVHCNKDLHGNGSAYAAGLRKLDEDIFHLVCDLPTIYTYNHVTIDQKQYAIIILRKWIKLHESEENTPRTTEERIRLRKELNTNLKLYEL